MKRLLSMLLTCALLLGCVALVEASATPPPDRNVIETELGNGFKSLCRMYDARYFEEDCATPGTIERFEYTTDVYGSVINQWANVYLPYGYDAGKQYNIIYFTHGTNETQDSFIGDRTVKNVMDNMIAAGLCDPFIMVCPTYYYEYETRTTDHKTFVTEVRKDLMPAIEAKYSTYAETPDEAGFIASRDHRAFAGYSQGGSVCWTISYKMFDYAKWYLPMASSGAQNLQGIKNAMAEFPEYADDVFFYISVGGKRDVAYQGSNDLVQAMLADATFSYGLDAEANNFYFLQSNEIHQTLKGRIFLYNAVQDVLFK